MKKFLADRFVPVWIEDKQDDKFAPKLGLPNEGYPNIAVYDGENEYLGRVVGFGGRDPWFENVKTTWSVSDRIHDAKAKAEKDPAAWAEVATVLDGIPCREEDALAAFEKIPEAKRGTDFGKTKASYAAKASWAGVDRAWAQTRQGFKTPDAAKAALPKALEAVEAWMKDHAGADAKADAAAWARKGAFLVGLDRKAEAVEVALKLLKEWPESPQAQGMLRGLR